MFIIKIPICTQNIRKVKLIMQFNPRNKMSFNVFADAEKRYALSADG